MFHNYRLGNTAMLLIISLKKIEPKLHFYLKQKTVILLTTFAAD
ncbi:hypothetical protein HMPREF0766_12969 [Sphingobacterium spiritivorum ATCC 33861]|uniref:Uncharacterized protein n=1 Tax=Sphingobacterium spiritivorum ATCC 33861 TaxID=525373 RepID=D7VPP9_SPHSI|nr:hypothetical protein HMPREF0766_12969 [Sphingobacterium spiritivorum ATCC 33861]